MKKEIKLNPKVFREVARLINKKIYNYVCHAFKLLNFCLSSDAMKSIEEAGGGDLYLGSGKYLDYFAKWFKPKHKAYYQQWFGHHSEEGARERRVIALLLCADILEYENNEAEKPKEPVIEVRPRETHRRLTGQLRWHYGVLEQEWVITENHETYRDGLYYSYCYRDRYEWIHVPVTGVKK